MNICVLVDVYPHPFKPYFDVHFEELAKSGHNLTVYSGSRIPGATSQVGVTTIASLRTAPFALLAQIVRRIVLSPGRALAVASATRGLRSKLKLLALDAQLPSQRPDLILAHNLWTADRFGYLKKVMPDVPFALYYHGGELPTVAQISPNRAASAFQAPDVIYTNTRHAATQVIRRGGHEAKIKIVPVGFRLGDYQPRSPRAEDGHYYITSVGRISREKGFHDALQAIALLRKQSFQVTYTIIGDGPEFSSLQQLAQELGVQECVRFVGRLPHREVIETLAQTDLLVLSSIPLGDSCEETQACVVQEAMLVCAAIVATDIGGVRESLAPQFHDYMTPPSNAERLASQIAKMLMHKRNGMRALGEKGRDFVLRTYDVRATNNRLLEGVIHLS